jgi:hypothetical protein
VTMDEGNAFDLDLATAALLSEGNDVQLLLRVLAKQLAGALGDRLVVERKGGLLRRSEEIKALQVALAKEEFRAELTGGGVHCSIGHASGGIRIRSEEVEMSEWLHRLLASLQTEATHSQSARLALENIVIGGNP